MQCRGCGGVWIVSAPPYRTVLYKAFGCVLTLEYVHAEYVKRALLKPDVHAYCERMFVNLCGWRYRASPVDEIRPLIAGVVVRCCMLGADHRLDRFVPSAGRRRLFLSRYAQAKVYRFLGVPIWVKLYTSEGLPLTFSRAFECLRTRLRGGLRA